MKSPSFDDEKAFGRAARYCAESERCISQVRRKLKVWKIPDAIRDGIIERLVKGNYINETRFAREYAYGQFHRNKWGRLKIVDRLRNLNISGKNINEGLKVIDEKDYRNVLSSLVRNKISQIKSEEGLAVLRKVVTFAVGKGYESDLVWDEAQKAMENLQH
jgi:regulatory protein